jgi:hypothetical protein
MSFFQPHMHANYPTYLIFMYLIIVVIFDEKYSLWRPSVYFFFIFATYESYKPIEIEKILSYSKQAVHTSPAKNISPLSATVCVVILQFDFRFHL